MSLTLSIYNRVTEEQDEEQFDEIRRGQDRGQKEIMARAPFTKGHLIDARLSSTESLLHTNRDHISQNITNDETSQSRNSLPSDKTYSVVMKLIAGSLEGYTNYDSIYSDIENTETGSVADEETTASPVPTLVDTARKVARYEGTQMDEKQYVAYEVICCTFLLGLVNDGNNPHSLLTSYLRQAISSTDDERDMEQLVEELKVRGGQEQLLMFLTGPAGAGKSTAMMVARRFCFDFSLSVGTLWSDRTFLFTAYTGSAAMLVGGITICKAAYLMKKGALTEEEKKQWEEVRMLIIDEISFMCDDQLKKLDQRLKEMRDRTKPFGGISVIFAGDFRQLEPSATSENNLLFSRLSSNLWNNSIKVIIILNNEHRYKDDPEYGRIMKRMWNNDLSKKDRKLFNTRVVGNNNLKLPSTFEGDACYACPSNRERNAISAGNFEMHILNTHPPFDSLEAPPEHTIVIEADIRSTKSKQKNVTIDNVLRHRIITTCGDDNVKYGNKHVDPALCLYIGAYLICIVGNEFLKEKVPRGNGTLCRLVSMKIRDNATSHTHKKYYGKKVATVCAKDVEWIECKHVIKTEAMVRLERVINDLTQKIPSATKRMTKKLQKKIKSIEERLRCMCKIRRFKLEPQNYRVVVSMKPHNYATTKLQFTCQMTQFPVNLNDATTGHKLQGMSKDVIIITSWPKGGLFRNWEYTVLSRVRTLNGLYMFNEIDMNKSFKPSTELAAYFKRARTAETKFLKRRKKAIEQFYKR